MKKLFIFLVSLFITTLIFAQSVAINNDGSAANASSILDVKSTTKGMLIPRMTSAQRAAIISPALGLLVFDTDTKTIWAYDGTAWVNLTGSGGTGFTLPFSQEVDLPGIAFSLGNINEYGTAIKAYGTTGIDASGYIALKGYSLMGTGLDVTSTYGKAIDAKSFGTDEPTINAVNNYGKAIYALSKKQNAITGEVQVADKAAVFGFTGNFAGAKGIYGLANNASSYGVYGENAIGIGVFGKSMSSTGVEGKSNTGYGVRGHTTTSDVNGAAVVGLNAGSKGNGVLGIANFNGGIGVQGTSNNGTGVFGYSNSYRGVAGGTISGTALYGNSLIGYALEVSGKVKISGGNTNPSAGAVLTSDAQGNAVWKNNRVGAFKVINTPNDNRRILESGETQMLYFNDKKYDFSNSYNMNTGIFTAPTAGFYHFDLGVMLENSTTTKTNVERLFVEIFVVRNGLTDDYAKIYGSEVAGEMVNNYGIYGSVDFVLLAGDEVWVRIFQLNSVQKHKFNIIQSWMSGYFVF